MTQTKRTPAGPAHYAVPLFSIEPGPVLAGAARHDLLALHGLLVRAGDELQGVAATALRCVAGDEGKRVEWHFASMRDLVATKIADVDACLYTGGARPDPDVLASLLGAVQRDLDHYRTKRTCPPAGIWAVAL